MALNSAFENVYHVDDSGNHTFYTRVPGAIKPAISNKPFPGVNYSGMLMSPFTGTGRLQDPTISPQTRRSEVEKTLKPNRDLKVKTTKLISYTSAGSAMVPGKPEQIEQVLDAVHHSGIPTHLLPTTNISETRVEHEVSLNSFKPTSRYTGFYTARKGTLTVSPDHPDVVIHEVGHSMDSSLQARDAGQKQDIIKARTEGSAPLTTYSAAKRWSIGAPIYEGKADGFNDRYSDPMRLESSLRPGQTYEAEESSGPGSRANEIRYSGYGISHWGTPLDAAAYVASRAHTALSPTPENNSPELHHLVAPKGTLTLQRRSGSTLPKEHLSESEYAKHRSSGKKALEHWLGYMVHHHEHVRSALEEAGTFGKQSTNLSEVGEQARTKYLNAHTDAVTPHPTLGPHNFW